MNALKVAVLTMLVIAALCMLGFGSNYLGLVNDRFFMPRQEQLRHDTFECSASHTDGLVHEIRDYRDQYDKTDNAGKAVLRQRVMQDFNSYTCGDLPADVQSFVTSIR